MLFRAITRYNSRLLLRCHTSTRNIRIWPWKTNKLSTPTIYQPRREPWLTPTLLLLGFVPLFTFGLGIWQLRRLKWKVNLIDELEEKLQLAPLRLPKRINLAVLPEFAFRKVIVQGRLDYEHAMILMSRVREGMLGAHVVVPLVRQDGTTVLVDCGFITQKFVEGMKFQREEGEVEILGMLRLTAQRNTFTPTNLPHENKWYSMDHQEMADFAGGESANVQPVLVERIFDGHAGDAVTAIEKGIPIGRPAYVDLRNAHLSYVITWFSLSAITTFGFTRLLINRSKRIGKVLPKF